MNKKPIELHLIQGTKNRMTRDIPAMLPDNIRNRIPAAPWGEDPAKWDKQQFIADTADFLFNAYGIGNDQDQHIITMLADQMDTYVQCVAAIRKSGLVTKFNNGATVGQNPYLLVKNKSAALIIQMMGELGLTPRGRLAINKSEDDSAVAKLMRGPGS